MALEIERKFLIKGDFRPFVTQSSKIIQAYLTEKESVTVSVRLCNEKAYLKVKNQARNNGLTRNEWEFEIPKQDGLEMLSLSIHKPIQKIRHQVPFGKSMYEVDEFMFENEGLILAEIELVTEDQNFDMPDWLGQEVTGDERYYNSYLFEFPYKCWKTTN